MTKNDSARLELFAVSAPGIEGILERELSRMGIVPGNTIPGGVSFSGHIEHMMRVNLWSRVATRIIARVEEFHASTFHELERRAKRIPWSRFISTGQVVRFRVSCRKSRLYHSDAVAERLGKAVAAAVGATREAHGDDELETDAQLFIVRISNDECTISVDSSGELLHRRGYRQSVAKAPLRETLAAAMLYGSGWDMTAPLVDPMCGSGTIAIEGAMIARKIAPGVGRSFAFEKWPGHDISAWKTMVDDAQSTVLPKAAGRIIASDRDAGAVAAARENASRAGVEDDIEIVQAAVSAVEFPNPPGWLVSNPPYGLRVGESAQLRNLYAQLGKILRDRASGYRVALLSADKALEAQLRLDLREVFRTSNGGIPVRLVVGE